MLFCGKIQLFLKRRAAIDYRISRLKITVLVCNSGSKDSNKLIWGHAFRTVNATAQLNFHGLSAYQTLVSINVTVIDDFSHSGCSLAHRLLRSRLHLVVKHDGFGLHCTPSDWL